MAVKANQAVAFDTMLTVCPRPVDMASVLFARRGTTQGPLRGPPLPAPIRVRTPGAHVLLPIHRGPDHQT